MTDSQGLVNFDDIDHDFKIPSNLLTNMTWWYMKESKNIDPNILKLYKLNRKVDGFTYYFLIVVYSILICVGTCGNMLVVCAVLRKPYMRSTRNIFIVNLAVSDLLLCLVTMPLTLMEILTRYWPLGANSFSCKIIGSSQALCIYVSTLSITAIALDRYHVIVNPTHGSLKNFGAMMVVGGIWITSIVLASPMYFFRKLEVHQNVSLPGVELNDVAYCVEDWSITNGRAFYSIFVLIVQYVLPITIVTVSYSRICKKLQRRYTSANNKRCRASLRRRMRYERNRRTNALLVAISLVYCVSWLPLDICNLVLDFTNPFGEDYHTTMIVYATCHMMGMSSACSNPLLYGWLNDNFRKEFKEILSIMFCCNQGSPERSRRRKSRAPRRRRRDPESHFEEIAMKVKSENVPADDFTLVDETKFRDPVVPKEKGAVTEVCHATIETYNVEPEVEVSPSVEEPEVDVRPCVEEPEVEVRLSVKEPAVKVRPFVEEPEVEVRPSLEEPEVKMECPLEPEEFEIQALAE